MTKARVFSQGGGGSAANALANISLADLSAFLTTANVREVSNLYYSNSRVFANLSLTSINDLFDVETRSNTGNSLASIGYGLIWTGNIWTPGQVAANLATLTTDDIAEGSNNLYFSNALARRAFTAGTPSIVIDWNLGTISANLTALAASANTTDSIPEGAVNFYYRDSRAYANLTLAHLGSLRDVYVTDEIYPAGHPNSGNIIDAHPNGGALVYNSAAAAFFVERIVPTVSDLANALSNLNTDALLEGSNNLYYKDNRVVSNLANLSINVFADVDTVNTAPTLGYVLTWTGSAWEPRASNIGNVGVISTATNANFANLAGISNVALVANQANIANFATLAAVSNSTVFAERSNVANISLSTVFAERSNVANSTVFAEKSNVANLVLSLSNFTTTNLAEGSNLYYTDSRVFANVSQMSIDALYDVSTSIANVGEVLTWSGTNWYSGATVGAAQSAQFAERSNVANLVLSLSNFTTDNLTEGSNNFYYTSNRLAADIQSAIYRKDIELDDLILGGDLTVQGNAVLLNVSNVRTESRTLTLALNSGSPSSAEGSGIYIDGANARFTYGQTDDGFGLNKNLTVLGNILPAISGVYNIGSPSKLWRGIYVGAQTIFLGNLAISDSGGGGIQIQDQFGNPAGIDLANLVSTQFVTVNRLSPGTASEINGYFGGNVQQFTSGQTANIYFGVLKDGTLNKFAGMRITETKDNSPNVRSDIHFYNDREGTVDSTARLSLLGTGNIVLNSNLVTINGIRLIDNFGNFVGNAYLGTKDVAIERGGTAANTRSDARQNIFSDFSNGLVAKVGGATNTLVAVSIAAGTGVYVTDGDAQAGNPTIAIGQNVHPTASVTFNNVTVDGTLNSNDITATTITATGDLIVSGNLTIRGNVTTVNSTTVSINDKNIVLANNAINAAEADGGGITINGANATFTYSNTGDKFVVNKNLDVAGNIVIGSGTGGNITGLYSISADNIQLSGDKITVLTSVSGSPSSNASFVVNRGTSTDVDLKWDESVDRWQFTNDGTLYYNIPKPEEYDNVTYNISIQAGTIPTNGANLKLVGSKSGNVVSTDVIEIVGDSLISVTRSTDDKILISASAGTKVIENVDNSGDYVLDLFGSTVYRSAKYLYTAKTTAYLSGGPHFASGEILVMHDGANTYITQYALLSSSADDIVTVTTDINNSNVRLLARATLGGTLATVRLTGITYTEI
jgi:hypothetical protein